VRPRPCSGQQDHRDQLHRTQPNCRARFRRVAADVRGSGRYLCGHSDAINRTSESIEAAGVALRYDVKRESFIG
jgi:hypothetical protein